MKSMRLLACIAAAVFLMLAATLASQDASAIRRIYGDLADKEWRLNTSKGDVATGVIIGERDQRLLLDGDPCKKELFGFKEPYDKKKVSSTKCDGETLDVYRVEQK